MILAFIAWIFVVHNLYNIVHFKQYFESLYSHVEWTEEQRKHDEYLTNRNFWAERMRVLNPQRKLFIVRELFFTLSFIIWIVAGLFTQHYSAFLVLAMINIALLTLMKFAPLRKANSFKEHIRLNGFRVYFMLLQIMSNIVFTANVFMAFVS